MTALALIDRNTGEVVHADASALLASAGIVDVRDADTEALAQFIHNVATLKSIAAEAQGEASDELVARLDRNGRWTLRIDGYEIKSASPEAGTVTYNADELRAALAGLLADGAISQKGADAALERIQPTAPVPYGLLRRIAEALDGRVDMPEDWQLAHHLELLLNAEPEPTYRVRLAGVKALLKVPAAREAVEACRVDLAPQRRSARVKRVAS